MKPDLTKNHIDRMLELSEKYEKEGNKEKSNYWLDKAERFEEFLEEERAKDRELKQKKNNV